MTGRHEFHSGVTHTIHERERMALSQTTFPELLKTAGYTTVFLASGILAMKMHISLVVVGLTESSFTVAVVLGRVFQEVVVMPRATHILRR